VVTLAIALLKATSSTQDAGILLVWEAEIGPTMGFAICLFMEQQLLSFRQNEC
jgi:hypothetical protein